MIRRAPFAPRHLSWTSRGKSLAQNRHLRVDVLCMANPLRVARVSKQIRREIAELFLMDKVMLRALEGLSDSGLDQCATIMDVQMSGDLQVAKVYVALYAFHGDDKSEEWKRICQLQPYVRKKIGQNSSLRRTPEVRFILDRDFEKMERALDILEQRRQEEKAEELGLTFTPRRKPSPLPMRNRQTTVKGREDDAIPSVETMFTDMF